ncbi:hypothetical protein V1478_014006 [Vespula squamosa]|uniref:Uncharacterized protein n=1 Tax=Vespula squamosa TaxID=30214 RepID=A0ABD2A9D7_VESSQ
MTSIFNLYVSAECIHPIQMMYVNTRAHNHNTHLLTYAIYIQQTYNFYLPKVVFGAPKQMLKNCDTLHRTRERERGVMNVEKKRRNTKKTQAKEGDDTRK